MTYHKFLHDDGVDLEPIFEKKLQDMYHKVSLYLNRRDMDLEIHVGENGNPHGHVAWTSGFRIAIHLKSKIQTGICTCKHDQKSHSGYTGNCSKCSCSRFESWSILLDENTPMEYYAFLLFHEYGHTQYAPENDIVTFAVQKLLQRDGVSSSISNQTHHVANIITDIIINVSMLSLPGLDKLGLNNKTLFKQKYLIENNLDVEHDEYDWDFYQWHKWFYNGKTGSSPDPSVLPLVEHLFRNRKMPVHLWKDEFYELFKELVKKWQT